MPCGAGAFDFGSAESWGLEVLADFPASLQLVGKPDFLAIKLMVFSRQISHSNPMPADPENNDFKLDPEARSFRISESEGKSERRSDLPRVVLVLALLIVLYAAFPELQGAVLGVVAGLAIGYRAGVGAGKRQEREA